MGGVRAPQRSIKFYADALRMGLVEVVEAFFCFGECDHDTAAIRVPRDQPAGSSGLAHPTLGSMGIRSDCGRPLRGPRAMAPR